MKPYAVATVFSVERDGRIITLLRLWTGPADNEGHALAISNATNAEATKGFKFVSQITQEITFIRPE